MNSRDTEHVFEQLRKGLVPERGIDAFAVGIERQRGELRRQLELVESGEGSIKFLRGGYGCGKTFMARLLILDAQEQGFVLVTLFTLMIPMLIVVVAFSSAMTSRSNELRTEFDQERALLACESGVDDAIYQGKIGGLSGGLDYGRDLGGGQAFTVETTYLKTDGLDNDNDGNIDEDDEDVFQVIVTGTYRQTSRRLAAYLGPVPLLPTIEGAVATQDPNVSILLQGTPLISGTDTNINGTPGSGVDVPGFAIAPPGTIAHLLSELSPSEQTKVVGPGGPPSLGLATAVDVPGLAVQLQNMANIVLTSDQYASFDFGDGSAGTANITYRNGDVTFAGNTRGAGILIVTGDLEMKGNFRFDGVIIVLGKVDNSAGTARVYGSILQGPSGGNFEAKGTFDLRYSSEAITLANSVSGRYVALNGWQEISR